MTVFQRKTIPGPHPLNPFTNVVAFQRAPLQFLAGLQRDYGPIVQFRLVNQLMIFMSHPDSIKHVLQDNYLNYDKDVALFQSVRPLGGNGLVTVIGGDDWLRQRRLVQPAFHRQRIAALGRLMTDATMRMLQQWEAWARERQVFDAAEEMSHLTFQILTKSLFNIDASARSKSFRQALLRSSVFLIDYFSFPFPPLFIPLPRHRRFWSDIETMDTFTYQIIHDRQKSEVDVGDLLSMLLSAVDENGQGMDDKLLRDEMMTLLLGGHETTATVLAWTWCLLAQHPEVEERLHAELDQILAGRIPTVEDLPQLKYTRMVLEEAARLYPPVWVLMRRAMRDDEIGGYAIPAQSSLLWSSYLSHRLPDFWEKPEQFYPEHFSEEQSAKRPRHAYMPWSLGPRICIGNAFAMTLMPLILATIAQQYRLALASVHPVEPEPHLTLRPKNGVLVSLERR